MIDKTLEITAFLKKHYLPTTIQDAKDELQLSTSEVLNLLFQIFPTGCIDDYDLHQLLTTLGYEPQKRGVTDFVWCLKEVE
ncbi:hypothetical protein [uncultured Polaribacter sp.]|uniref:hypothetical protein n=1 Tax=uncultured Polaribacter sp. TaxID=174711 RepID=UPI0026139105|nr:hypothetical protein [uncultured Polaribacter sp.]